VKLSDIGEFGFIDRIARNYPAGDASILKGIGDDTAVIPFSGNSVILLTTDQLIEGFHFCLDTIDGRKLGWKALAVNLSDIAAMGGTPIGFVLSLGIPAERTSVKFLDNFYQGLYWLGNKMGVELLGGDTSEGGERFIINISLLGKACKDKVVYRDGGQDEDDLYVTGRLGDAALGLKLVEAGGKQKFAGKLLDRHLTPMPRIREGKLLAERKVANAMIDISDGLLADLNHILVQSKIGAEIELSRLPLSKEFQVRAGEYTDNPLSLALGGGEDYELLFSVSSDKRGEVARLSRELTCPLTRIGRLSRHINGVVLKDENGRTKKAAPVGYDHFKTLKDLQKEK